MACTWEVGIVRISPRDTISIWPENTVSRDIISTRDTIQQWGLTLQVLEHLDAAEKKIEKLKNEGADKGKPPKKAATPNILSKHPILEDPLLGKAKQVEVLIAIKPLPNREPFEMLNEGGPSTVDAKFVPVCV
ncbi:uncharacterized protein EDB91DRAFT_1079669 [Suillus paluster]|uniref:uncharacterized protein n=1 Tax=Suillus paluster TaxID=48578 RepID=UPI001B86517B|nr:uncharacterized protein EDB91DRAFT_1079669 [Suillus paluster]KAG1747028.1 hypothetical protein EDB91DRAFT_1079669 [Suillus paluster]